MGIYAMRSKRLEFPHRANFFMMRTLFFLFLITGILLASLGSLSFAEESTASTQSIVLPTDPFSFQPGKGQEVANAYCSICHSADYIYMQPDHSEEKWAAIIHKMKRVFGCPIPQDQIPGLATYLFNQNSISPSPPTGSQ
jgi:cytochrome c5